MSVTLNNLIWYSTPPAGGGGGFEPQWAEYDDLVLRTMKKNVASQSVGCQMVAAADGTAFTGSVSVAVTKDNGTQTAGGGTAPAHEGNGYHSYTPTQGETDADHIAFTFTGTGAIPRTVQVYTTFPQTGDSYARLGAPAGASVSADIAGVQSDTDNIQTRLPTALVSGRMDASVGAMAAGVITAAAHAASSIDAAALATDAVNEIADGLLNRDMSTGTDSGTETLRTVRQALRVLRNKTEIAAGTLTVKKEDDSTTSWTGAVTTTAGNPISSIDPASA
jgi:hypothetical protein